MYLIYVPLRGCICQTSASRKRKTKCEKCFSVILPATTAMFACRRRSFVILFFTLVILYFFETRKRAPCSLSFLRGAKMAAGAKRVSTSEMPALGFSQADGASEMVFLLLWSSYNLRCGFSLREHMIIPKSESAYRRRIYLIMGHCLTLFTAKKPSHPWSTRKWLAKRTGPIILQGFRIRYGESSPFGSASYIRIEIACRRRIYLKGGILT